ncbi:hypothetical protein CVD28_03910 [Bacillus sp. M6-12]|uniref:hypothetical protein n=1 Tax=Bacillus sp. M6-12 TaxID=2054166 RepID=UPI000C75701D|nr:hypothetical protein [Bacillus sp. M6-12]PLS19573.1 hypothetical protein CVD28_03910 [Bacillus sp. M6-12]
MSKFSFIERKRRLDLRNTRKFKSTNKIWNDLGLNHAWTIGYLTKLFKAYSGKDYEAWERFYYQSGEKRLQHIHALPLEKQTLLKDFKIPSTNQYSELYQVTNEEKNLNAYYGRTEQELVEIGSFMYQQINKRENPLFITEKECIDFVKIRVLDEIFIGIEREINTIKKLETFFPEATFKEVSVEMDAKYAVDYEVYLNGELMVALQIKSSHYKVDNQSIVKKTKAFNHNKNIAYTKEFGVDVLYIYATETGYIEDRKTFPTIYSYLYSTMKKRQTTPVP